MGPAPRAFTLVPSVRSVPLTLHRRGADFRAGRVLVARPAPSPRVVGRSPCGPADFLPAYDPASRDSERHRQVRSAPSVWHVGAPVSGRRLEPSWSPALRESVDRPCRSPAPIGDLVSVGLTRSPRFDDVAPDSSTAHSSPLTLPLPRSWSLVCTLVTGTARGCPVVC